MAFSDLRGVQHEMKHARDQKFKWSHGVRPKNGSTKQAIASLYPDEELFDLGKPSPFTRPGKKWSDYANNGKDRPRGHNSHTNHSVQRMRVADSTAEEMQAASQLTRSEVDLMAAHYQCGRASVVGAHTSPAKPLHSYDCMRSPLTSLPLGAFVKTSGRETEKLVEKEYEILDGEGESLKGKRARRTLRGALKARTDHEANERKGLVDEDDEEYELV